MDDFTRFLLFYEFVLDDDDEEEDEKTAKKKAYYKTEYDNNGNAY